MPSSTDQTPGRNRPTFASDADINEFVSVLERYERGEITPDQWRGFRLVRGTYGQRQTGDVQMLRVKIPQGVLNVPQLQAMAECGEKYSRGFGHITTRQNIQFHFMKLHDVEKAMKELAEVGLTTREACGNSVRNITACPYAGVSPDEVFDVTPYAEGMTRFLLRHRMSSSLPRKFKIAFEGCPTDHAATAIHDMGWFARIQDGVRGFKVVVGGGTSILCKSAGVLYEFLPASQMFEVTEAVLRVWYGLGDYKHKARNRMKFMIKEMGWDTWRTVYEATLAQVRAQAVVVSPIDTENPPVEGAPDWKKPAVPSVDDVTKRAASSVIRGPGIVPEVKPVVAAMNGDLSAWRKTNVRPQKQPGYSTVTTTVILGDLTSQQMRVLGDLAAAYGDGSVRVTIQQDLVFRWVRNEDVPELYRRLAAAGLGLANADTVADVVSCPGAEACRLAVTQSRGLGRELGDFLRSRPDLIEDANDLQIKMSGCPNGCGQHHIAGIGFQGSVRKLGEKVLPQYFVMLGGSVGADGATFGRLTAKIPARRVTEALERLIALYKKERQNGETATAFFRRVDVEAARSVIADLEKMTPQDAQATDYVDLGEDHEYKVEILDGECSA